MEKRTSTDLWHNACGIGIAILVVTTLSILARDPAAAWFDTILQSIGRQCGVSG